MRYLLAVLVIGLCGNTLAADGNGKIISIFMAGKNFGAHPDIAQFVIDGGFHREGCNETYAGIRVGDEHLISLLLAAKMGDREIEAHLDSSDQYFNVEGNSPNRCVATALSIK